MITDDIKIVMLGASESGKTCYMLGMYARMQFGLDRLTLRAIDRADSIMLNQRWGYLLKEEPENRWPSGTRRTEPYKFVMSYAMAPLVQFSWLDYRGGALMDDGDKDDVKALLTKLEEATCVFLCISGKYLVDPVTSQFEPWFSDVYIEQMNAMIDEVYDRKKPTPDKPIPFVILITQFDRCQQRDLNVISEEIRTYLFPKLFDEESNCITMICPVSLGTELAGDPPAGKIDPVNVELPVIFAIYMRFREFGLRYSQESSSLQTKMSADDERNWLSKWWNSDDIKARKQEYKALEGKIDDLQEKVERLMGRLDREDLPADIYELGRKIRIQPARRR